MSRQRRADSPGSWHHVMNRGLSHRTIFESREDIQYFLDCLGRSVRRNEIEIHAFAILSNHFHLLLRVRKSGGFLSHSMGEVQSQYVKRFNRMRRRDGPLFRGRFKSCKITSNTHWLSVLRYIDLNPVTARIVVRPELYQFCSAHFYCNDSDESPQWLTRIVVEREACRIAKCHRFDSSVYRYVYKDKLESHMKWFVNKRLEAGQASHEHSHEPRHEPSDEPSEHREHEPDGSGLRAGLHAQADSQAIADSDPIDHLIYSAPDEIRSWMIRNAHLADNSTAGLALIDPKLLLSQIRKVRKGFPQWNVYPGRYKKPGWRILAVGLLRSVSGESFSTICELINCGESSIYRYYRHHQQLVKTDQNYANRAVAIVEEVLKTYYEKDRSDLNTTVKIFAYKRLQSP